MRREPLTSVHLAECRRATTPMKRAQNSQVGRESCLGAVIHRHSQESLGQTATMVSSSWGSFIVQGFFFLMAQQALTAVSGGMQSRQSVYVAKCMLTRSIFKAAGCVKIWF